MNRIMIVVCVTLGVLSFSIISQSSTVNWSGLTKGRIELKLPLLTIRGSKGFLACGYIDVETCNKTNEACAIVSGVNTHDDMLSKKLKAVSKKAKELGLKAGMSGRDALELLK